MENNYKHLAVQLFNETWDLLDKENRNHDEDMLMIHKAHTSLYMWSLVGTKTNLARGEWQISRVYASLDMGESALFHGLECLKIVKDNDLSVFDKVFAYEAIARAYSVNLQHEKMHFYQQLGMNLLSKIEDEKERKYALKELENIK